MLLIFASKAHHLLSKQGSIILQIQTNEKQIFLNT